jgi:carboxymethylenebutenolidase
MLRSTSVHPQSWQPFALRHVERRTVFPQFPRPTMKHLLLVLLGCTAVLTSRAQDWANQQWARGVLEKSPRHLEWVSVKQGPRDVKAFLGFPEVKNKATAIVLIHENRGLTDWVRSMVDQFAEAGYIAIAPDLLSGSGPNGGGTAEMPSNDEAGKAISALNPDQVTADLKAIVAYVSKLPACNGKVVVGGFCWGGRQTFRFATNSKDFAAALVFYGDAPSNEADYARISVPVHGFYGGNDARINAGIPKAEELMKKAGKSFDYVIYEGAGHGYMRSGQAPDASDANKKAREESWQRIKAILAKI